MIRKGARCCLFTIVVVSRRSNAFGHLTILLMTMLLSCKYYDYCSYYFQAGQIAFMCMNWKPVSTISCERFRLK